MHSYHWSRCNAVAGDDRRVIPVVMAPALAGGGPWPAGRLASPSSVANRCHTAHCANAAPPRQIHCHFSISISIRIRSISIRIRISISISVPALTARPGCARGYFTGTKACC
jgi:hypothetical protein